MKRTLLDPLYRQRVDFCNTKEDFVKAVNRRCRRAKRDTYPLDHANDCSGMMTEIDGAIVMGVFDGKDTTLVHECVHVATKTLRLHGIPVTYQNDEALAYMVEWFFQAWQRRMA